MSNISSKFEDRYFEDFKKELKKCQGFESKVHVFVLFGASVFYLIYEKKSFNDHQFLEISNIPRVIWRKSHFIQIFFGSFVMD
jgi:hypothetical protein